MFAQDGVFEFADVRVDTRAYRFMRNDREIALEPKAFAVLLEFIMHAGEMLSRDALLDAVWGHRYVTPATINRIIVLLRRALGDDPEAPHYIQTVRGKGYRFVAGNAAVGEDTAPTPPALRFAPPSHARVPARVTEVIGRDREIADIDALLGPARALTIIGAGGMGKTTVALEVARARGEEFADGVWFFDLATHASGEAAARAIAATFGAREGENSSQQKHRLLAMLQTRRALLVLDNCERIAHELGAFVAELLAACPQIVVLTTSQCRLDCVGEQIYALPALAMPAARRWNDAQALTELAAIASPKLLIARARALAAPVELSAANADNIAELCRQLDGMPLAIELAAVRLRVLDPAQLLVHLNERFGWLAGGGRTERHQTLGLLLAWSFSLLGEEERRLLCSLSVFADSWTLEATIDFTSALGIDSTHAIDLLSGLADKSLLVIEPDHDPPRYRLLDSVRLYARLRLSESSDEDLARGAHFAHLHTVSLRIDAQSRSVRQTYWFEWMRQMVADMESALSFAAGQPGLHATALNFLGNLTWCMRSSWDFPRLTRWLDTALECAPNDSVDRARCLIAAGMIAHFRCEHARCADRFRAGISMAHRFAAASLAAAGSALFAFELALCDQIDEARTLVAKALVEAEKLDDAWLRSLTLLNRGLIHARQGNHRDAVADLADTAAIVDHPEGDPYQLSYTLINLGLQQLETNLPGDAARTWHRALEGLRGMWHWRGASCTEGASYIAGLRGEHALAARFLAAAARAREQAGAPLLAQWLRWHNMTERAAHETLGEAGFAAAKDDPATRRIEEIAAEASDFLRRCVEAQDQGENNPRGS